MISRKGFGWGILCAPLALMAGTMHVQVEKGQVRSQPSYLGKVVTVLPYGYAVQSLGTQGSWTQIQLANGQVGWMADSALTAKGIRIKQTSSATGSGASADDLALAGKGFSASIENEFKRQNPTINFAAVNRMENDKASTGEMQAFVTRGGLRQPGGAK